MTIPFTLTPSERRVLLPPRPALPEPPKNRGGRRPGSTVSGWGKTGVKFVYVTPEGRFLGKFRHRGEWVRCGVFRTVEEAGAAVVSKRKAIEIDMETLS